MGYRFCEFVNLLEDSFFSGDLKETLLESIFEPGLDFEEGKWKLPFEKKGEPFKRDIAHGLKLLPARMAKDISNHFVFNAKFEEEYDEMLELPGSRVRILEELDLKGLTCSDPLKLSGFLFSILTVFLQAFEQGTDRITTSTPRDALENELLDEVNYCCPKCNKHLITDLKAPYMAEHYDIYKIFPKNTLLLTLEDGSIINAPNINSNRNYLVLCKSHRKKILESETKDPITYYQSLNTLKEKILRKTAGISKADAMESIVKILNKITTPHYQLEKDLRIKPLDIKKKIDPKIEGLLFERVCSEATPYYDFIRTELSLLDDRPKKIWKDFASFIANFSRENPNLDQWTIYDNVTQKILDISTVDKTSKNTAACGYITSFFIQNCEVFDEISK